MEAHNEKTTAGGKPLTVGWFVTSDIHTSDEASEIYTEPAVELSVPPFLRYWAGEMPIVFLNAVLK